MIITDGIVLKFEGWVIIPIEPSPSRLFALSQVLDSLEAINIIGIDDLRCGKMPQTPSEILGCHVLASDPFDSVCLIVKETLSDEDSRAYEEFLKEKVADLASVLHKEWYAYINR